MQQENKVSLTKNYLLVNEIPVDEILDDLVQQHILSVNQKDFIAQQPTRKDRARALLELLPRKGPRAFHALCYALLARNENDLVSVLTDPDKEDMEVYMCFPEQSRFHLGGETYLVVETNGITLKKQTMQIHFPLIRWKQLQYLLDDLDETVHYLSHNRYVLVYRNLGGNVYVSAESPAATVDVRYYWLSPLDYKQQPTPQEVTLNFQQFNTLKDVDCILLTLIPTLNDVLPCEFTHQNVESAIYSSECNPNVLL